MYRPPVREGSSGESSRRRIAAEVTTSAALDRRDTLFAGGRYLFIRVSYWFMTVTMAYAVLRTLGVL
jgi:hypothetical protein